MQAKPSSRKMFLLREKPYNLLLLVVVGAFFFQLGLLFGSEIERQLLLLYHASLSSTSSPLVAVDSDSPSHLNRPSTRKNNNNTNNSYKNENEKADLPPKHEPSSEQQMNTTTRTQSITGHNGDSKKGTIASSLKGTTWTSICVYLPTGVDFKSVVATLQDEGNTVRVTYINPGFLKDIELLMRYKNSAKLNVNPHSEAAASMNNIQFEMQLYADVFHMFLDPAEPVTSKSHFVINLPERVSETQEIVPLAFEDHVKRKVYCIDLVCAKQEKYLRRRLLPK